MNHEQQTRLTPNAVWLSDAVKVAFERARLRPEYAVSEPGKPRRAPSQNAMVAILLKTIGEDVSDG